MKQYEHMNRMWRLQWRHQWLWCWHQPGGAGSQAAPPPPPPLRPALRGPNLLCQDWHRGWWCLTTLFNPCPLITLLFTCLSCLLFQGHDAVILEDMLSHQWRPPILWVEWFRNFQFSDIKNLILEVGFINEHDVRTLIDIITLHSIVRMTTSAPPNQQGCSKLP